jgi:Bacteriophage related domain of unknown function
MSTLRIQNLLDAHVTSITGVPTLQEENTLYNATGSISPWVRGTLLPAQSQMVSIGVSAMKKVRGLYQVDCFYPQGQGSTAGRTMADAVVSAFPIGLRLTDGVVTVICEIASVMSAQNAAGKYVNFPVQVQWSQYE